MALDTLEKRRNVPGVGRPWMRVKHPVATPDEQWRMASGLTYGGNPLDAAAALVARVGTMYRGLFGGPGKMGGQ